MEEYIHILVYVMPFARTIEQWIKGRKCLAQGHHNQYDDGVAQVIYEPDRESVRLLKLGEAFILSYVFSKVSFTGRQLGYKIQSNQMKSGNKVFAFGYQS